MVSTSLVNLAHNTALSHEEAYRRGLQLSEANTRIYRALSDRNVRNTVKAHMQAFGPQDYCFTGEYRYWVWHDPGDRYRVFVSNQRGISFEVNEAMVKTFEEGLALHEEYANKLIKTVRGTIVGNNE